MSREEILSLLIAKARVLLHDPPRKAWVLAEHKDIAKYLREKILGNASPLNSGLESKWEGAIKRAAILASSFDRWLINTLYVGYPTRKHFLSYYRDHNIFDPRYSFELSHNVNRVDYVVEKLGRAFSEISRGY